MDLQYIYDNTTSPPTQSILQYKVDPDTVYVSTDTEPMMVNLTITVFNPTEAAVNCQNFQFGIHVGNNVGQLASTDSGIQLTTDQSQWSTNAEPIKQGALYWYTAAPAQGVASEPLAASGNFIFHLENIPVNNVEGGTLFMILEVTDADPDGVQGSLSLSKEQSTVLIVAGSFTVIPATPVSPGTQVNLSWKLGTAAEYWLLYNTTLSKLLYDSRKQSQPQMNWQDKPEAWTEYELIVYAGQMFTFASAVAQVTNPRFLDGYPPTANPASIDACATSIISWRTADAQYVIVTADDFTQGPIDSSSGQGQCEVYPMLTTTYTVTTFSADGKSGEALEVTVSVYAPAIKSFTASPNPFQRGQAVTLSWEVESVNDLTLNPGNVSMPSTNNYTVHPTGQVVYQLTAQGQGAPIKSDPITVTQLLETFPVGNQPRGLAYDGTYIWTANSTDNTVTRLLAADGSHQGTFTVGQNPYALAYDGTRLWVSNLGDNTVAWLNPADGSNAPFIAGCYANALACDKTYLWLASANTETVTRLPLAGSVAQEFTGGYSTVALVTDGTYVWLAYGDNTVTRLLAADGSNQGNFTVGNLPSALAYDGTYIWVANQDDGTVTRLRATDGRNYGTFPVGQNPDALVYDGAYIWVANQSDGTVTRLLAADGSHHGTFPVGNYPFALVCDGTSIWICNFADNAVARLWLADWPPS